MESLEKIQEVINFMFSTLPEEFFFHYTEWVKIADPPVFAEYCSPDLDSDIDILKTLDNIQKLHDASIDLFSQLGEPYCTAVQEGYL